MPGCAWRSLIDSGTPAFVLARTGAGGNSKAGRRDMNARENCERVVQKLARQARPIRPDPRTPARAKKLLAVICDTCKETFLTRMPYTRNCPQHVAIAKQRKYAQSHREKCREFSRKDYQRHRARRIAESRARYLRTREHRLEKQREYYARNRDVQRARQIERRTKEPTALWATITRELLSSIPAEVW